MSLSSSTPAEAINSFMKEQGWTQQELAEQLGVSRQTANYLVNGRSDLTGKMMLRLAKLTDQPVDYWHKLQSRAKLPPEEQASLLTNNGFHRQSPGLLVNQEILTAIKTGDLQISDFEPNLLTSIHYPLHLGDTVVEADGALQDQGIAVLEKGKIYSIPTLENLTLPDQVCAHLEIHPDLGELGFQLLGNNLIEPGHQGPIDITLASLFTKEKHLATGDPLLRISFEWLAEIPQHLKDSRRKEEIKQQIKTLEAEKDSITQRQHNPFTSSEENAKLD